MTLKLHESKTTPPKKVENNLHKDQKNVTPPYLYLVQVLQHCPRSGVLYLELWKNKNKNNSLRIIKDTIRQDYLTTITKMRTDLLSLAREALISFEETSHTILVELVGWDDEKQDAC